MAYSGLFHVCLSNHKQGFIFMSICVRMHVCLSLCGRSECLLLLSLSALCKFPVESLSLIHCSLLSAMEKVPGLQLYSFDVEFDVHQNHLSRKAWKLIQQLTLTELSYINYEPHQSYAEQLVQCISTHLSVLLLFTVFFFFKSELSLLFTSSLVYLSLPSQTVHTKHCLQTQLTKADCMSMLGCEFKENHLMQSQTNGQ